jgi:Glycosyl hydrolase family 26
MKPLDLPADPARRRLGRLAVAGALVVTGARAAPARRIPIGVYGGAGCTGVPAVQAFQAWLGRPVQVVLDFLQTDTWSGMENETQWIAGCWQQLPGRRLAVSVPMLVAGGHPTLEQGAEGRFDDHFRTVAHRLIAGGHADAFLRIGWEFNGGWYPWTARGHAAAFARYWRRIALAMRGVAGARFAFDWSATTVDGPTEAAYPGDDVVDVIGLDVYNQSWPRIADPARRWSYLLHHPAGLIWHRTFAKAHGKPRSFPEWGTGTRPDGHGGGDDPLFIRNMIAWMEEGGPVIYQCYWNYQAPDYDAMVTNGRQPLAAAALRDGLRNL